MIREPVIVSVARSPIGIAYRGSFSDNQAKELAGHVIGVAAERAGVVEAPA